MRAVNPAFIPRNHLVEAALDAAVQRQDFQPFEELLDVVSRPYEDRPNLERYARQPAPRRRQPDFLRDIGARLSRGIRGK
jgi:serine/tyrosine/threonine adenylyltransferase